MDHVVAGVIDPKSGLSLSVPSAFITYSFVCVPAAIHRSAPLSRQVMMPRHEPDICELDLVRHPLMGRSVPSYQRTRFASYQRPAAWYSVPFRKTPGGNFKGMYMAVFI